MNKIFRLIGWFNENHTAEELLGVLLIGVIAGGVLIAITHTIEIAIFLVGIGGLILLDLYIVTYIQRWYVRRTKKRLEDFDYSEIIDETMKE